MTVPVIWWNLNPDAIARGYWDQTMLEDLFGRTLWHPAGGVEFEHHVILDDSWLLPDVPGAIFVVPARHNVEHIDALNEAIGRYDWCIVIGTGDEESVFPWEKVGHPRRKTWGMGAMPGTEGVDHPLGSGYSPGFPEMVEGHRLRSPGRLSVFFCGQDTHERRHAAIEAARVAVPAEVRLVIGTTEFLADGTADKGGLDRDAYAAAMADTMVAPCPSGPESPDSFRLYEALEAGAVPVADGSTPKGHVPGYWPYVFGGPVPFPVLDNWAELAEHVARIHKEWPAPASRVAAWWTQSKRRLAYELEADIHELAQTSPAWPDPDDQITVLIPTCPIDSHPDTAMIEAVVASVREQLPRAEIIVVCDGIRPSMESKAADYEEFLLRLARLCLGWHNVVPIILPEWGHQANGTRAALELVTTPLILFVEHDTPVVGEIDWPGLCYIVDRGIVNMIRLHHETEIGDYHRHMMLDDHERIVGRTDSQPGVPIMRTFQWSQRPHLATTKFYRERVMPYFGRDSRTYIEWIMHGACQHGLERGVEATWDRWRIAIYHPSGGNIQRSTHLDGRAGGSIDAAVWAYDGTPPPGAPPPSNP